MTKRVHQGTAIGGMVFAAAVMVMSLELQFYTKLGPGPGFFPFILAGIFGFLSLMWLIQVSMKKDSEGEKKFLPNKAGLLRVGIVALSLVLVRLLMNALGYPLTMFLFLFGLTVGLGKRKPLEAGIVAAVGSVGVYYLFGKVVGLLLPASSIPFLAAIGL
ncbi:tripartite tricarboxylate transporter TctB family protein [bacterium]|nr:tripartite tricarboxylate transporter TctB family protein [bacterium]